jgi:PadR family transcriptional regulator PadR
VRGVSFSTDCRNPPRTCAKPCLIYLYTSSVSAVVGRPRFTDATLDVLEVLLSEDDELYGLKIAKAIARPTGSVFPILARLEQLGWLVSEWEDTEPTARGPRRRFYRLSPDGRAEARTVLTERRTVRRVPPAGFSPVLRPGTRGAP